MKQTIKEVALDYIDSERECNFYAANHKLTLRVYDQDVDVESIWRGEDNDKVYLHCGCKEFEADIDIESLSDENQERVREVLSCVNLSPSEVRNLAEQWKDVPLIFLFRVSDVAREEVDAGMSREECFKRCANYYLLSEFGDEWNDTDDDVQRVPEVKNTWCYVSPPERKSEEQTEKKVMEKFKVTVIYGEYAARAYANGGVEEMSEHMSEGQLTVREFDTEAERRAYIMGIDDSDGWLGAAVLSEEDAESATVKELLRD